MSLAIAHFAVGSGVGALIAVVSGLHHKWYGAMIPYLFGVWAMVPDLHHIMPFSILSDGIHYIHDSMIANIFVLHRTMDLYDVNDTKAFAGLCLLFMFMCLSTMWIRFYTEH